MASSMDSLLDLDGEALVPEMEDSLDEESLGIQVREVMSLDVYQELMKDHLDKIVHEGGREAEVSRMEAAKVMGMMESTPALIQNLSMLMRDESPEVVSYALESAGKLKRRELVPFIISQLSNPYLEGVAHKVLVNYGNKILGTLKDYMGDSEEDIKLRKAIPGILARSGLQRAADLLAAELQKEQKDIEPEIIAALYKMRSKNLLLQFPERIILPAIIEKIKECHLIISEIHTLLSDKKKKFMAKNLENNLSRTLKYIFDLLSLVYPRDDIIKAYQNICAGTKKSIDYSIELLDNLVKKDIMEGLIPLIEDIPLEDKVRKSKKLLRSLEKVKLS